MSFVFVARRRPSPCSAVISYSVAAPGKRGGKARHGALLGADVLAAMGWGIGDKVTVGYGRPGSEHAGWAEIRPDPAGTKLRITVKGSKSVQTQIHFYPDFVTDRPHPAEHCATWKRVGEALRVRLPDWVFGDHPHAGKPKTGEPDNSRHAEAGGGDSSVGSDAPPAEIRDTREESRDGLLPPTGASIEPVPGAAPERTAARNSSSGPGEANGTTLKGEMAGHTGGDEEAATVAPPVREHHGRAADITGKRRIIFAALARASEAGEETPTLLSLSRLVGSNDPGIADYHLRALEKSGHIRREGARERTTYLIVATGKSTEPRVSRLTSAPAKPTADTRGGVAPVNEHFAQALAEKTRRVTQSAPPVVAVADKAVAQIVNGPASHGDVIAWLNDMGMTCRKLGTDNYLLGDEYVGWRHVLARANRKRRMRNEPEFTVA